MSIYGMITTAACALEEVGRKLVEKRTGEKLGFDCDMSKDWEELRHHPENRKSQLICKGQIELTHMENQGMVGGSHLLPSQLVNASTAFLIGYCANYLHRGSQDKPGVTADGVGTALILGGAIHNMAERVLRGSVSDYLRFPKFPIKAVRGMVFNISDLCVLLGMALKLFKRK